MGSLETSSIERHDVRAGLLILRSQILEDSRRIGLVGELDLASAGALKAELDSALEDDARRLVVDMSELTFIDSTGIAMLVSLLGADPTGTRIGFVPSRTAAVRRVLELTGVAQRLPLAV